jgi:hypothetical protein
MMFEEVHMQKRLSILFVGVAVVALSTVDLLAQAKSQDPWIGTWKGNLEKSTFSPGPKPTVPATVKIERSGDGMKTTIDGTDPQGKPTHSETVWMFDGKDHPVKGGPAPNMTAAYKRIDDRTFEVMGKVDGKPTMTTRVTVSADGKTMTATQTGTTIDGQSIKNVIVAEKQ